MAIVSVTPLDSFFLANDKRKQPVKDFWFLVSEIDLDVLKLFSDFGSLLPASTDVEEIGLETDIYLCWNPAGLTCEFVRLFVSSCVGIIVRISQVGFGV